MRFCLDDLLLRIGINHNGKQKSENYHRRICVTIQLQISHIAIGEEFRCHRHNDIHDGWRKRIDYSFYCCRIRALLCIRGENKNQVFIRFIKEHIEKLESNVKEQDCNHFERHAHMFIRHPNKANC